MSLEIDDDLLEVVLFPGPGRGVTAWALYPGFPPIRLMSTAEPPSYEPERWSRSTRDSCLLMAYDRLHSMYDKLSAHEELGVQAKGEEVRAYRRAYSGRDENEE